MRRLSIYSFVQCKAYWQRSKRTYDKVTQPYFLTETNIPSKQSWLTKMDTLVCIARTKSRFLSLRYKNILRFIVYLCMHIQTGNQRVKLALWLLSWCFVDLWMNWNNWSKSFSLSSFCLRSMSKRLVLTWNLCFEYAGRWTDLTSKSVVRVRSLTSLSS